MTVQQKWRQLWAEVLKLRALIVFLLLIITGFIALWQSESKSPTSLVYDVLRIGGITVAVTGFLGLLQYWLVSIHEIRRLAEKIEQPVKELVDKTEILSSTAALGIVRVLKSTLGSDADATVIDAMRALYFLQNPTIRIASVNNLTFFGHGRLARAELESILKSVPTFSLKVILADPRSPSIIERSRLDLTIYSPPPNPFDRLEESISYYVGLINQFPDNVQLFLTPVHPMARVCLIGKTCFYHPLHLGYRKGVVAVDKFARGASAIHALLVFNDISPNYALAENHFEWLESHSISIQSASDVTRIMNEAKPLWQQWLGAKAISSPSL